jgi:hypothetical protein
MRKCERFIQLDGRLPGILADEEAPADVKELLELAELCSIKRLYRAVARFLEQALTRKPELADDLRARYRYLAASGAALAAAGQGKDAGTLGDAERSRLRLKALDRLRADLAAWAKHLEQNTPKARTEVRERMQAWRADPSFAGVRGKDALAKLPKAEGERWQKLWDDVAELMIQAESKPKSDEK